MPAHDWSRNKRNKKRKRLREDAMDMMDERPVETVEGPAQNMSFLCLVFSEARKKAANDEQGDTELPKFSSDQRLSQESRVASNRKVLWTHLIELLLIKFACLLGTIALIALVTSIIVGNGRIIPIVGFNRTCTTTQIIIEWLDSLDEELLPLSSHNQSTVTNCNQTEGLQAWFSKVNIKMPFINSGDLAETLKNMGLDRHRDIVRHLESVRNEPLRTEDILLRSLVCLEHLPSLSKIACLAADQFSDEFKDLFDPETIGIMISRSAVIDILTNALAENYGSLNGVVETMQNRELVGDPSWESSSKDWALIDFLHEYYDEIAWNLKSYVQGIYSNEQVAKSQALQKSILTAVKLDLQNGFEANARVGIALATSVTMGKTGAEPFFEDHKMVWPLGESFVETFMAWKLAFIAGSLPISLAAQLFIPSVTCSAVSPQGSNFMAAEFLSFPLYMMDAGKTVNTFLKKGAKKSNITEFAQLIGKSNLYNVLLPPISKEAIIAMLDDINSECNEPDDNVQLITGLLSWIATMFCGMGLELFGILSYCKAIRNGFQKAEKIKQNVAHFLAPLFSFISFNLAPQSNAISLLTTIASSWKFGYPETIAFTFSSLLPPDDHSLSQRIVNFLNGAGTFYQHGACSMLSASVVSGLANVDDNLIQPVVFTFLQQLSKPIHQLNEKVHIVLQLGHAICFVVFFVKNFKAIYDNHWTLALAGCTMILAEILYILAAAIDLYATGTLTEPDIAHVACALMPTSLNESFPPIPSNLDDDGRSNASTKPLTPERNGRGTGWDLPSEFSDYGELSATGFFSTAGDIIGEAGSASF